MTFFFLQLRKLRYIKKKWVPKVREVELAARPSEFNSVLCHLLHIHSGTLIWIKMPDRHRKAYTLCNSYSYCPLEHKPHESGTSVSFAHYSSELGARAAPSRHADGYLLGANEWSSGVP